MRVSLSIGKKMLLIGIVVFLALCVLGGNSYLTNARIQKTSHESNTRTHQLETVEEIRIAQLNLMLAAMDAIIDREEGTIDAERIKTINDSVAFIQKHLKDLGNLADTEEEKKLVKEIEASIPHLAGVIQKDLVQLIENSAKELKAIRADFVRLDDDIDNLGDPITEKLAGIFSSVQAEQIEAMETANLRNGQMALLNDMMRHHGNLMLAAMDSIIDKETGVIDKDRMASINASAAFIEKNLDKLVELADTEQEKKDASLIKDTFPKLSKGIRVGLVNLITSRASESEFVQIDDLLDNYGDPMEEALVRMFLSVREEQEEAASLANLRNKQLALLNEMIRHQGALILAAMDSIIDKEEGTIATERLESMKASVAFLSGHMNDLKALADTEQEKKDAAFVAGSFPKLAQLIQTDLKALIEKGAVKAKEIEAAFTKIDDDVDQYGETIEAGLHSIALSVGEEQDAATAASDNVITMSTVIGLAAFCITLAVILPLLYFIARSIIKPIRRIIEALDTGAEQVASASGQVSSSSQQLAEGASEQAASIEETSASLEEMSSMTKQNADHAQEADNLMKDANSVVAHANDSMTDLTQSMQEISVASEETQKIIKTIDEIAFQTNLLALNAAVEAARAGEAGAGFAVVADEVRNLAMRAADAAKNTAELIEGTVKKIASGTDIVSLTNESFEKVALSASKVGELVGEIAAASSEQSKGIDQVNLAVNDMDKVTQRNAANAEESASACEEMNAQAQEMKRMVDELVGVVNGSTNGNVMQPAALPHKELKTVVSKKQNQLAQHPKNNEVNPSQVIPLDEDDFQDF